MEITELRATFLRNTPGSTRRAHEDALAIKEPGARVKQLHRYATRRPESHTSADRHQCEQRHKQAYAQEDEPLSWEQEAPWRSHSTPYRSQMAKRETSPLLGESITRLDTVPGERVR